MLQQVTQGVSSTQLSFRDPFGQFCHKQNHHGDDCACFGYWFLVRYIWGVIARQNNIVNRKAVKRWTTGQSIICCHLCSSELICFVYVQLFAISPRLRSRLMAWQMRPQLPVVGMVLQLIVCFRLLMILQTLFLLLLRNIGVVILENFSVLICAALLYVCTLVLLLHVTVCVCFSSNWVRSVSTTNCSCDYHRKTVM